MGAGALGAGALRGEDVSEEVGFRAAADRVRAVGLKLGVASYSLRNFSRAYAIQAIQSLGTPYVNIKSFHLPYDATPSELAA